MSLTVQDPETMPEVEIARENHCHSNHQVALVVKSSGREMAVVETNVVTEIAEMTVKVGRQTNAAPIKIA